MLRNLHAFDQAANGCVTPEDMQHNPTALTSTATPLAAASGRVPLLLALLTFALTLLLTYGAYSSAQRNAQTQLREAFDYRTRDMVYGIGRRLAVYEQVLRGARGYLRGSLDLTRAEFRDYYRQLRLDQSFPGLEALGVASVVRPGTLAAHQARVRAEGFSDYSVYPDGERPLTSAISHIEPFSGRNLRAFGFDMYSEPVRRAAMAAARDSGQAALSGKVVLVQEGSGGNESGFLMYLPVYRAGAPVASVEQRRAALLGWVYAPFRMRDLMRGVGGLAAPQLDIEIHDGDVAAPEALLYRSPNWRADAQLRSSTRSVLAGRTWLVTMASSRELENTVDSERPRLVAGAGLVLAVLTSLVVWLLAGSRRRALLLAHAMTLELRESHDRIATEKRRVKVILETAYDGFLALDRHGRITDWNARATQIFGLARQDAIGRPAEQLVPIELRPAFHAAFGAFAGSGASPLFERPFESEALHSSGRRVPVELALAALPDKDRAGITVFVRDITQRREANARLEEARQAMHRSQKLEAVGKLTGGVAHDFNNILHIISANVQLMLRADGPPDRKRLHNILDAVERGSNLAGQLLAFARRQPLHPSVVQVDQLLDRSDSLLRRAAGDAVILTRSQPPDLWPILVDPNQLEHVLLNLVINARDAMEGGGSVALQLANVTIDGGHGAPGAALPPGAAEQFDAEMAAGEYVAVAVSDTGHGMPLDVMEHAFEPFFTTKPEGKGTGLGLSMAHGFVRQSGGHIRLASAPGAGTTVTIYLPRHVAKVVPAPIEANQAALLR